MTAEASPPCYWMVDWLVDRVYNVRHFGGLNAASMGNLPAPSGAASSTPSSKAFRSVIVPRNASEGFRKGSRVYLIDYASNRTWVSARI
jgi:hypothetical protein